ncbi:hypothetical protein MHU86_11987 [Fragilaria crotonensis]|nr:hypothetical protein MHU86_11987 [Fragilaria crotonensis]
MWKRLAYLPRADAYCCEAGGRIFYPVPPDNKSSVFKLEPFDGADESELEPFSLEEDMEWRLKMEMTAGVDGFVGNELDDDSSTTPIPIDQRKGPLWEYCRQLQRQGFVVDTTGYSVCFRVNRKQQDAVSRIEFDALSSMTPPEGIATSVNLGCVDFYPHDSGKKNCCQYVARKLCTEETVLGENALCLCDDDNDLEMALACKRAFVPGISSTSMAQIIEQNPIKITVTGGIRDLDEGTSATERALDAVLDMAI